MLGGVVVNVFLTLEIDSAYEGDREGEKEELFRLPAKKGRAARRVGARRPPSRLAPPAG